MIERDGISAFTRYRDEAHLKYEIIRPVLLGQSTARNRAFELQLHEKTIAKYLRCFRNDGYTGLLDQRHGPLRRKGELSELQQLYRIVAFLARRRRLIQRVVEQQLTFRGCLKRVDKMVLLG